VLPPSSGFLIFYRFLLITLQLRYVFEARDPRVIRKRLDSLPRNTNEAYKSVMERISDKQFAGRILGWILHAQRPLTMTELQVALTFDADEFSFSLDDQPTAESIVQTCCGLIEHSRDTDSLVTFSHALAREYLENYPFEQLSSHSTLALACLAYFQLPGYAEIAKVGKVLMSDYERDEQWPFAAYAAHFWATHSKFAGRDVFVETKILEIFKEAEPMLAHIRIMNECWIQGHFRYSLLPFLIEEGLAMVVMRPLTDVPFVADSYVPSTFGI